MTSLAERASPSLAVLVRGAPRLPTFIEVGALTEEERRDLLQILITRLMKLRTRPDVLVEEMGQTYRNGRRR